MKTIKSQIAYQKTTFRETLKYYLEVIDASGSFKPLIYRCYGR
jgi:hypothetical protein